MKVMFSPEAIAQRVAQLGNEITEFYRGKPLVVIAIANGGIFFAADLLRKIDLPLEMDTIEVASYVGNKSTGKIVFRSEEKLPVAGKNVLLIDDVLDTGVTLRRLCDYFRDKGAVSCRTVVAVDKKVARAADGVPRADWYGFVAPERFLIGYGMDSDEIYRNLPFIGVLD